MFLSQLDGQIVAGVRVVEQSGILTLDSLMAPRPDPKIVKNPPAPESTGASSGSSTQNWLSIGSLIVAVLALFLGYSSRSGDAQQRAGDEHISLLIKQALDPAVKNINDHLDKQAEISDQKTEALSDRVSRIEGKLENRVSALETKADRQASLAKLEDPGRTLGLIRAEIEMAASGSKHLTLADLHDYKNAVQDLPSSAYQYSGRPSRRSSTISRNWIR